MPVKTSKMMRIGLVCLLMLAAAFPALADNAGNPPVEPPISSIEPSLLVPEEEKVPVLAADYIANINYNLVHDAQKLANGHLLICRVGSWDPGVIEVDQQGTEVWYYRGLQANSARRLDNGNTLVADSGAPGAPFIPRVVELTPEGKKAWEYVLPSVAFAPRYAERLANGNTLMVLPFEIREVDSRKKIIWQYGLGKPGKPGTAGYLAHPVRAHRLSNGNTLIVDRGYSKGCVLEVTPAKKVVWQFAAPDSTAVGDTQEAQPPSLIQPLEALRLAGGTTWVTDKKQDMVFLVDTMGQAVQAKTWSGLYKSAPVTNLWTAQPGEEGNVLITATMVTGRTRVAEVVGESMKVVWDKENTEE